MAIIQAKESRSRPDESLNRHYHVYKLFFFVFIKILACTSRLQISPLILEMFFLYCHVERLWAVTHTDELFSLFIGRFKNGLGDSKNYDIFLEVIQVLVSIQLSGNNLEEFMRNESHSISFYNTIIFFKHVS